MANLSNILPPGGILTTSTPQTLTNKTITEMLSVISTNTTAPPSRLATKSSSSIDSLTLWS